MVLPVFRVTFLPRDMLKNCFKVINSGWKKACVGGEETYKKRRGVENGGRGELAGSESSPMTSAFCQIC